MRCKECREQIPDNTKKYCPECGALVNNYKYKNHHSPYNIPQYQKKTYEDIYTTKNTTKSISSPFSKIKDKKRFQSLAMCIGIMLLILFIIGITEEDPAGYTENEIVSEIFYNTFEDNTPESETDSEDMTKIISQRFSQRTVFYYIDFKFKVIYNILIKN